MKKRKKEKKMINERKKKFWIRTVKIIVVVIVVIIIIISVIWNKEIIMYVEKYEIIKKVVGEGKIIKKRMIRFLFLTVLIVRIKLLYKNLCLEIWQDKIKKFMHGEKKINKVVNRICLVWLKWTNIIYIYNDILLLITIMMSIARYNMWKVGLEENAIWKRIDEYIYKIFFIIIKNIIEIIVVLWKKRKKAIIEIGIKEWIKKRVKMWIIVTVVIMWIGYMFDIKWLIIIIIVIVIIYIMWKVYVKSRKEIRIINRLLCKYNYSAVDTLTAMLGIKEKNVYDELMETNYILKNCKYEENYKIMGWKYYATRKEIDGIERKEIRMNKEERYCYQAELYFKEEGKKLKYALISKVLNLLKYNIIYIMRINRELEKKKKEIKKEEKESLKEKKKEYEKALIWVKKIVKIWEEEEIYGEFQMYDCYINCGKEEYFEGKAEKKIEVRVNFVLYGKGGRKPEIQKMLDVSSRAEKLIYYENNYNNKSEKSKKEKKKIIKEREWKKMNSYYESYYKEIRKISKEEEKYEYSEESNEILDRIIARETPVEEIEEFEWEMERKGKKEEEYEEEYLRLVRKYDYTNIYIINFEEYINKRLGLNFSKKNLREDLSPGKLTYEEAMDRMLKRVEKLGKRRKKIEKIKKKIKEIIYGRKKVEKRK